MDPQLIRSLSNELQKQRRMLLEQVAANDESFGKITDTREPELEEHAQEERLATVLERLDEREQDRIRDIDAALARIEAGVYGRCENCGQPIEEDRLHAIPTTTLCVVCSGQREDQLPNESEDIPQAGPLPPDLDGLDDEDLQEHLFQLVREDGQVDSDELQIVARRGVVYLEGAVPSDTEHDVLLSILTDVAGIREIVDHLEIQRLAWERSERSKEQSAQDVQPGAVPDQEPYGGTEDPVLSNEEGVTYEPPVNPPPPPTRKE